MRLTTLRETTEPKLARPNIERMKFNWRANWEILLVLVIIVVGIVITTIAAIRSKGRCKNEATGVWVMDRPVGSATARLPPVAFSKPTKRAPRAEQTLARWLGNRPRPTSAVAHLIEPHQGGGDRWLFCRLPQHCPRRRPRELQNLPPPAEATSPLSKPTGGSHGRYLSRIAPLESLETAN